VAAASAGGQDTIGLRCPAHPVAQQLLAAARGLGVPGVSAPSANRFGRVSPTRAEHVRAEFGPDLLVLDGGDCEIGIESTIVDCTREPPALLRPGGIAQAEIEALLGVSLRDREADSPRASGSLESHYAPRAAVRLIDPADWLAAVQAAPAGLRPGLAVYSRQAVATPGFAAARQMPADVTAVAHELYAVLRELDADGVTQIWVERPPAGSVWDGVNDRLRRAAAA
jgi:L-threonylcarbamoyladenylate synthase